MRRSRSRLRTTGWQSPSGPLRPEAEADEGLDLVLRRLTDGVEPGRRGEDGVADGLSRARERRRPRVAETSPPRSPRRDGPSPLPPQPARRRPGPGSRRGWRSSTTGRRRTCSRAMRWRASSSESSGLTTIGILGADGADARLVRVEILGEDLQDEVAVGDHADELPSATTGSEPTSWAAIRRAASTTSSLASTVVGAESSTRALSRSSCVSSSSVKVWQGFPSGAWPKRSVSRFGAAGHPRRHGGARCEHVETARVSRRPCRRSCSSADTAPGRRGGWRASSPG